MSSVELLDAQRLERAVGKVFGDIGVGINGPLVLIGDRLDLWKALAAAGPVTPAALAERTGLVERYLREWLRAMTVAGYLDYSPDAGLFTLSPEMAAVLADDEAPTSLIGVFTGFTAFWAAVDKAEEFFRTGHGMGWGDHHPALNQAQERFTRPMYLSGLIPQWIPAVKGMDERLRAGARIADIGCGHGLSTRLIAQAWPASSVVGFDIDDGVIGHARQAISGMKLDGRISFEVADAAAYPGEDYDLVLFTDCLHDMGHPVEAAAHARRTLAADGVALVIEPLAADRLEDDLANPYAPIGYAVSTLVCTPSALAQGGEALGTMAGEGKLREVLSAAGFSRISRIAQDAAPFNIILEARP